MAKQSPAKDPSVKIPSIESFQGKWRIRFMHQKKSYTVYTGLEDSRSNKVLADATAYQIGCDIKDSRFDTTLESYKYKQVKPTVAKERTVISLWTEFMDFKFKYVHINTFNKHYRHIDSLMIPLFGKTALVNEVTKKKMEAVLQEISKNRSHGTIKRILTGLNTFWLWMMEGSYASENPIPYAMKLVKRKPRNMPNAFSKEEVEKILSYAKASKKYEVYYPIFAFLFFSGCRTGEAIGLQWGKINYGINSYADECPRSVTISASMSDRHLKDTKTGTSRVIHLTGLISQILRSIRPIDCKLDDYCFVSRKGIVFDNSYLSHKVWTKLLKDVGLPHRKLYSTRHTFISHALDQGISPTSIAKITGHSVQVLFDYYAGLIGESKMPDII